MATEYQYHSGRNIASLETRNSDGSVLMAFQYGYDGNGNRTVKAGVQDGKKSQTRYGYDAMQRIQKAVYPDGGCSQQVTL